MKTRTSRIVKLVHPKSPPIRLIGAYHLGTEGYYANISNELSHVVDGIGGIVHYEGIGKPTDANNSTIRDRTLLAIYQQARFSELYAVVSKATGLVAQKSSLNYEDPRWENHDISALEMLRRLGLPRVIGLAAICRSLVEIIELIPEGKMGPEGIIRSSKTPKMQGRFGQVVLDDRNSIAFTSANEHMRSNPDRPLALLWGDGHLDGLIDEFMSIDYRLGEITELQPFQGIVNKRADSRDRIGT